MKATPEPPASVATTAGVTLADRLNLRELPLATTPGGKAFAMKALHPSEHTIKCARMPGGNKPSVALACDMVMTFPLTTGTNPKFMITQMPSILTPCQVHRHQGGVDDYFVFFNAAFGGAVKQNPPLADYRTAMAGLATRIANYRITSQSVTAEVIAPLTASQGSIIAAEYSVPPRTMQGSIYHASLGQNYDGSIDMCTYTQIPNPEDWLMGTNAYVAKAVEGVYQPLKFSSFKWKDMNDPTLIGGAVSTASQQQVPVYAISFNKREWPSYCDFTAATQYSELVPEPKYTSNIFGMTYINGIDGSAALRIRVRQVVEITAPPGSLYAPLLETPLPPDELAQKMYFEISGRMKDGYPASWNALGTLAKVVMSLGSQLLPFVEPVLAKLGDTMSTSKNKVVSTAGQLVKMIAPGAQAGAMVAAQKIKKRRAKRKLRARLAVVPEENPPPLPPRQARRPLNIVRPQR